MLQLIINADVFSPTHLGLQQLLIGAGKILHIGTDTLQLDKSLAVTVMDAKGKRLLPGFIDGHAHITGGGGESGPASRVPPVPISQFTSAGVTTVVGLLGTDDLTRNTQTLVTQARGLKAEGITAYCYTGGYHLPPTTLTDSVKSDIVFLDPILGVGELAISDHRSSQPTLNELLRIASEAHVAGLMTGKAGIVHFHLGDGKRGLDLINQALDIGEIPARVFNPTHVNRQRWLFEQACELVKRGCTIDVTTFPADDESWSASEAIQRYVKAGLPADKITVSSDGGGCLPKFDSNGEMLHMDFGRPAALLETFQELLRSGLSIEQTLPIFSTNVARLLKLSQKGEITMGKDADLILIDEKNQITDVMAMGQWHVSNMKQKIVSLFEENH